MAYQSRIHEYKLRIKGSSLARWERITEWPLVIAALLFFAAYAIPIIWPHLDHYLLNYTNQVIIGTWIIFGIDYIIRLILAKHKYDFFKHNLIDLASMVAPRPAVAFIAVIGGTFGIEPLWDNEPARPGNYLYPGFRFRSHFGGRANRYPSGAGGCSWQYLELRRRFVVGAGYGSIGGLWRLLPGYPDWAGSSGSFDDDWFVDGRCHFGFPCIVVGPTRFSAATGGAGRRYS